MVATVCLHEPHVLHNFQPNAMCILSPAGDRALEQGWLPEQGGGDRHSHTCTPTALHPRTTTNASAIQQAENNAMFPGWQAHNWRRVGRVVEIAAAWHRSDGHLGDLTVAARCTYLKF